MRLIECAYSDKPLIGQSKRPADDPVRFSQEVTLAFEPSSISRYIPAKAGSAARLSEYFFGLFGANGRMPLHITKYVKNRMHNHHDYTLARFADIFHHRMISLFYRARANTEPTFNFDRPLNDRFSNYTGSLLGLGDTANLALNITLATFKLQLDLWLDLYFFVLSENCWVTFVFVDEFDAFYHHALSRLIVSRLKEISAQVIITTHNTSVMTNDLLRPDCYFLMDKEKIKPVSQCTEKEL